MEEPPEKRARISAAAAAEAWQAQQTQLAQYAHPMQQGAAPTPQFDMAPGDPLAFPSQAHGQAMLQAQGSLGAEKVEEIFSALRDCQGQLPLENLVVSAEVAAEQLQEGCYPWYVAFDQATGQRWLRLKPQGGLGKGQGGGGGGGCCGTERHGDWSCPGCGDLQFQKNTACRRCGTGNPSHVATDEMRQKVEHFISQYAFEVYASDQLRNMTSDLQELIIAKGSLHDARDQTAVLIGRMRSARQGTLTVTEFAAQRLPGDWYCPSCNDLQFQKNTHCRKCQTPNPNLECSNEWKHDVQAFLDENGIQPHAGDQFKIMTPDLQKRIMENGSLAEARDRTAVLICRMAKARRGQLSDTPTPAPLPGDWYCPSCNDLQFQRNATCRKCGAANPVEGASAEDVSNFLSSHHIQPSVAEQFRNLAPGLQKLCMEKGSMADARDPTAVLISRMTAVRKGHQPDSPMQPKVDPLPGDWYCPKCNDLQFKKNASCRKCGTTNPTPSQGNLMGGGMMGHGQGQGMMMPNMMQGNNMMGWGQKGCGKGAWCGAPGQMDNMQTGGKAMFNSW